MSTTQFPELSHMMNAYFHRDYDINGDTDREIVLEYPCHRTPGQINAAIAEIDVILATSVKVFTIVIGNEPRSMEHVGGER